MTDMLKRAALPILEFAYAYRLETVGDASVDVARTALLAALDPEDPELALAIIRAVQGAMSATSTTDTVNRRVVKALRELVSPEVLPKGDD